MRERSSATRALARASTALRDGRVDDALAAVLDAWRVVPHTQVAELVFAISARIHRDPAAVRGRTPAAMATWLAWARRGDPADRSVLLETLTDVVSAEATRRIAVCARWPRDPRVTTALVSLLETLPFQAQSTRPFWRQVFAMLERSGDPRLPEALRGLDDRIFANTPPTTSDWFLGQLYPLQEHVATLVPPKPCAGTAKLAALVGRATVPDSRLADLLAAVRADLDDDGPRLVYADALQEAGDPRGEFIALQCERTRSGGGLRRRERELLAAHGKAWIGALGPIVKAGRFERGFLVEASIDGRKLERVRKLAGDPSWATLRTVVLALGQPVDVAKTIAVLHALPLSIRELHVRLSRYDQRHVEALRAATSALTHLKVRVVE